MSTRLLALGVLSPLSFVLSFTSTYAALGVLA